MRDFTDRHLYFCTCHGIEFGCISLADQVTCSAADISAQTRKDTKTKKGAKSPLIIISSTPPLSYAPVGLCPRMCAPDNSPSSVWATFPVRRTHICIFWRGRVPFRRVGRIRVGVRRRSESNGPGRCHGRPSCSRPPRYSREPQYRAILLRRHDVREGIRIRHSARIP